MNSFKLDELLTLSSYSCSSIMEDGTWFCSLERIGVGSNTFLTVAAIDRLRCSILVNFYRYIALVDAFEFVCGDRLTYPKSLGGTYAPGPGDLKVVVHSGLTSPPKVRVFIVLKVAIG